MLLHHAGRPLYINLIKKRLLQNIADPLQQTHQFLLIFLGELCKHLTGYLLALLQKILPHALAHHMGWDFAVAS